MLQTIKLPEEIIHFKLPDAVQTRLHFLLDQRAAGVVLTLEE